MATAMAVISVPTVLAAIKPRTVVIAIHIVPVATIIIVDLPVIASIIMAGSIAVLPMIAVNLPTRATLIAYTAVIAVLTNAAIIIAPVVSALIVTSTIMGGHLRRIIGKLTVAILAPVRVKRAAMLAVSIAVGALLIATIRVLRTALFAISIAISLLAITAIAIAHTAMAGFYAVIMLGHSRPVGCAITAISIGLLRRGAALGLGGAWFVGLARLAGLVLACGRAAT